MEWHYVDAGERAGPVDEAKLRSLVDMGVVTPHTLVWCTDMPDWRPFLEVESMLGSAEDSGPDSRDAHVCVECGKVFPSASVLRCGSATVCIQCKPIHLQRIFQGTPTGLKPRYANFWPRFFAKLLDMFTQTAIQGCIGAVIFLFAEVETIYFSSAPFAVATTFLGMAINFGYVTWFLGRFGATPGKMALGLRVIGAERDSISYGRAFLRTLGELVSGMIFGLGYLMVLYDEERRALHDRLCNTRVVHVE